MIIIPNWWNLLYKLLELIALSLPTDWLTDWLIGWLADWLIDWLIDWSIGWLADWLIDWLTDWLIGWLIDWLTDWLIGWLIDWLIGCRSGIHWHKPRCGSNLSWDAKARCYKWHNDRVYSAWHIRSWQCNWHRQPSGFCHWAGQWTKNCSKLQIRCSIKPSWAAADGLRYLPYSKQ